MTVQGIIDTVRRYINRDSSDISDDVILMFLNNVNGKLNRALKQHPKMLIRAEAVLPANQNSLTMPDDILQIKSLHSKENGKLHRYIQFYITGPYPQDLQDSRCFVDRGNAFEIFPTPIQDTLFVIDYYAALKPIDSTAGINFILQYHHDIYLYGALVECAVYTKDHDSLPRWQTEFETRLSALIQSGWAAHHVSPPVIRYIDNVERDY